MMIFTFPRILLAGAVALLLTYVFVLTPTGAVPASLGEPAGAPRLERPGLASYPAPGRTFIGVMTKQGPYDLAPVREFTRATSRAPEVLSFAQGWAHQKFDRSLIDRVADAGMLPMISWEPWDYLRESKVDRLRGEQPAFRLQKIIDGDYDSYISGWAKGVASLPYAVAIRFAHEMNGYWYPWCESANGNAPGDYVKAWRHVHDVFTRAGADNVAWVWSPNTVYGGSTPLKALYPGDGYVDWIGLSGYYGTGGQRAYKSFNATFNPTLRQLRRFTDKPLVITETGATNATGRKAEWVTQMFHQLKQHRNIIGVIWYETVKETDWRIASTPTAAAAFRKATAPSRFTAPWSPATTPLISVEQPLPGRSPSVPTDADREGRRR